MQNFDFIKKRINRWTLKQTIMTPMILFSTIAVIIALYINFLVIQGYINDTLSTQSGQARENLSVQITNYLESTEAIVRSNAELATAGVLDVADRELLQSYFLKQVIRYPNVDYSYYANERGGIVSSGIFGDSYRVAYTKGLTRGSFDAYEADEEGMLGELISSSDFDPRTRSWYANSNVAGLGYWTDVYAGAIDPILGISVAYPYFGEDGVKQGVFGADILLAEFSSFLDQAKINEDTQIFLVDEEGGIVASTEDSALVLQTEDGISRMTVEDSSSLLLHDVWSILNEEGLFEQLELEQVVSLTDHRYDTQEMFVEISDFKYGERLHWHLVIVTPEQQFFAGFGRLMQRIFLLYLVIMALFIVTMIFVIRWVAEPMKKLAYGAESIGKGQYGLQIETEREDAIGKMIHSFNSMSAELKNMFTSLNHTTQELRELNANLESKVEERTAELDEISRTDGLTGLKNRRHLLESLSSKIQEYHRYGRTLSVIIMDLDHFKQVNDTLGHLVGDDVLKEVAQIISSQVRDIDTVGRYGGEEFMIILPETHDFGAHQTAERIRVAIESYEFHEGLRMTISSGVAQYFGGSLNSLIKKADDAMYQAKAEGRNRVVSYVEPEE